MGSARASKVRGALEGQGTKDVHLIPNEKSTDRCSGFTLHVNDRIIGTVFLHERDNGETQINWMIHADKPNMDVNVITERLPERKEFVSQGAILHCLEISALKAALLDKEEPGDYLGPDEAQEREEYDPEC